MHAFAEEDGDEGQPLSYEAVPVDSLRQQMDRQCKARRVNYAELDEGDIKLEPSDSAQYGSGNTQGTTELTEQSQRAFSGYSDGNSGAMPVIPPYEFAVQAQDEMLKAPESVFSDGASHPSLHLHLSLSLLKIIEVYKKKKICWGLSSQSSQMVHAIPLFINISL